MLGSIAILWLFFDSQLNNVFGVYFCSSPQLGNLEMSLEKIDTGLAGTLNYSDGSLMDLIPEYSSVAEKLQLTFAIPQSFDKTNDSHHITLIGSFRDGIISGTIEDLGGLYPVEFRRNAIATIFRLFIGKSAYKR